MYNLKGNLHLTVCRSYFAKQTYFKTKKWPNHLARMPLRLNDCPITNKTLNFIKRG